MLQPKWLLFFVLFYGSAIAIGWMMNGVWSTSCMTQVDSGWSIEKIRQIFFFDYGWITGYLDYVRWFIVTAGFVAFILIGYEVVMGFIGRR